jgi:hypothetical protein
LLIAGHHSDLGQYYQEQKHAGQILPNHLRRFQEIYILLLVRVSRVRIETCMGAPAIGGRLPMVNLELKR